MSIQKINIYESSLIYGCKYRTTLIPGKHIIVERINDGTVVSVKQFKIGDTVEYFSHNTRLEDLLLEDMPLEDLLRHYMTTSTTSHTGLIKSITSKSIMVNTDHGALFRMKPNNFALRNYNRRQVMPSLSNTAI